MSSATMRGLRRAALIAFCALNSPHAGAVDYDVGAGIGCTHATLQDAILAAAANASAPSHRIRLTTGTLSVPNGLYLHDALADITIEGGYSGCGGTQGNGTRTVLDATGGADGTVLDIRYFSAALLPRRVVLSRLDITGGTGETGIGASSEGAGLELRGNLSVTLDDTRVRDNRAFRAAGILMQGGPSFVALLIDHGSRISGNTADTDGGGVWCYNLGLISVQGSSAIEFNEAGRDGGGFWLGEQCQLQIGNSPQAPGTLNLLSNNSAGTVFGGRGGGVFYQASLPRISGSNMTILGTPLTPTFVLANRAMRVGSSGGEGGAIYLEGIGASRIQVQISNAVFANNSAQASGSAISVRRGIDLTLSGDAARCSGAFAFGLCNAIAGGDTTALDVLDNITSDPAVAPRVHVRRTRFSGNTGHEVVNFKVDFNSGAQLDIDSSVFDANDVNSIITGNRDLSARYVSVIGNTLRSDGATPPAVVTLRPFDASSLSAADLSASVVWQPGATLLVDPMNSGRMHVVHNGCLLSNDLTGVVNPGAVRAGNPQLSADFVPAASSPAIDVCNTFFITPLRDAYGTTRPIDQSSVTNALGAYDLGAIERPAIDAMFANGFE